MVLIAALKHMEGLDETRRICAVCCLWNFQLSLHLGKNENLLRSDIYIYSFFVVHRVRKHSSKIDKENCIVCADNEKLAKRYVGIAPTWQISVCDEFSLVNHCFFKIVHLCLGLAWSPLKFHLRRKLQLDSSVAVWMSNWKETIKLAIRDVGLTYSLGYWNLSSLQPSLL